MVLLDVNLALLYSDSSKMFHSSVRSTERQVAVYRGKPLQKVIDMFDMITGSKILDLILKTETETDADVVLAKIRRMIYSAQNNHHDIVICRYIALARKMYPKHANKWNAAYDLWHEHSFERVTRSIHEKLDDLTE